MPRRRDTQDRTVRERVVAIESDMVWLKRAILGLYALFGSLTIALVAAALTDTPPQQLARVLAQIFS